MRVKCIPIQAVPIRQWGIFIPTRCGGHPKSGTGRAISPTGRGFTFLSKYHPTRIGICNVKAGGRLDKTYIPPLGVSEVLTIRYIRDTINMVIMYSSVQHRPPTSLLYKFLTDFSYASDITDGKSTSVMVISYNTAPMA